MPRFLPWKSCNIWAAASVAALAAVEVMALQDVIASPALHLTLARCLLLLVWYRCWGGNKSPSCEEMPPAPTKAVTTWRAAGAALPTPEHTLNLIKSRRSVFCRDLDGRHVEQDTIAWLLEAANWAPSHGRTDPWHFVVVQSSEAVDALARLSVQVVARDVGEEVARKVCKEFEPGVRWRRATAFIAIVMRTSHPSGRCNPEWEEISACACAVQNMHLMATALPEVCGYWSSWYTSVRESKDLKEFLGINEADRVLGFFILGRSSRHGSYRASRGRVSAEWR